MKNDLKSLEKVKGGFVFEDIVKEFGQGVMWLAYSYVKDKQIAEDITQEVFITVFQKMKNFRGESSIKTWIYKIASNRCKDVLRSWSYRSKQWRASLVKEIPDFDTPEYLTIKSMQDMQLSLAVLSLPVQYREIIYLHYFEELKISEISQLLNISQNTVKTRLFRGRNLIKDKYEKGELNER